jgi:hypothetical protein
MLYEKSLTFKETVSQILSCLNLNAFMVDTVADGVGKSCQFKEIP